MSIKNKKVARSGSSAKAGGRISLAQEQYIRDNIDEFGFEAVAAAINKSVEAVRVFCERKGIMPAAPTADFNARSIIKAELVTEPFYAFIQEQLTEQEITFFKDQYASHIEQFSKVGDVLFNEKMQIVHLVRNEILLDRVYKRQREFLAENEDIKKEMRALSKSKSGDAARLGALKDTLKYNQANFATFSREAADLQAKISSLRADLNANRAQRTKDLKSVDSTFSSYVSALEHERFRTKEGEDINIFRAAMELERARLMQWHMYDDQTADIPLLTPENYELIKKRDENTSERG